MCLDHCPLQWDFRWPQVWWNMDFFKRDHIRKCFHQVWSQLDVLECGWFKMIQDDSRWFKMIQASRPPLNTCPYCQVFQPSNCRYSVQHQNQVRPHQELKPSVCGLFQHIKDSQSERRRSDRQMGVPKLWGYPQLSSIFLRIVHEIFLSDGGIPKSSIFEGISLVNHCKPKNIHFWGGISIVNSLSNQK